MLAAVKQHVVFFSSFFFSIIYSQETSAMTHFNGKNRTSLLPPHPGDSHGAFFVFRSGFGSRWALCHMKTPFRQTRQLHIKGRAERNREIWWWGAALWSVKTLALLGVTRVHPEPEQKRQGEGEVLWRPWEIYLTENCRWLWKVVFTLWMYPNTGAVAV